MAEKKIEKSRQEKAIEKMQKEDEVRKEAKEEKETKPKEEKRQDVEKKPEKVETKKKITKKKLPEEIHTINLRQAYDRPTSRRAKAAIDVIRNYVYKHKRKQADISPELNAVIWERGISKPPRKVKVRLVIGPDKVTVYPVK